MDPLKRRFVDIDRDGFVLGPRDGRAASLPESTRDLAAFGALIPGTLGVDFSTFEVISPATAIELSDRSLGVKAGGEVIGKPGSCGIDDVRMDVVSMALVDMDEEGTPGNVGRSSASLLTEVGGLVAVRSSDLLGGIMAAERRLSDAGLAGGGILTLSRVAEVLVCEVSAWAPFLSASLGASSMCDEGARPAILSPLMDDVVEVDSTAVKGSP